MSDPFTIRKFEKFTWIDTTNVGKDNLLQLAKDHDLNVFHIMDSIQFGHLPKIEINDGYTFLILRAFSTNHQKKQNSIHELSNKIAFFYNEHKILTIHRIDFPFLKQLKPGIETPEDLVMFAMHKMIMTYEKPLEFLNHKIDEEEQYIFLKKNYQLSIEDLYYYKEQMRISQKLLRITQNVLREMPISDDNKSSLQDNKDLLVSLILEYDELIENSFQLLHTYLSINAQKNNDVMKLLTIFSAFFLPLTFIAGIYGMNFRNMPELTYEYGYYAIWVVMLAISALIWVWFKRKQIL